VAPFDGSAPNAEALVLRGHAEPDHFKEALARLAGGLAIVSYWDAGQPQGILVSSITGLSVDPPRFLFCVRKQASSHDAFLRTDRCGITILSRHDEDEAQTFIQPDLKASRFKSQGWRIDAAEAGLEPAPPLFQHGLSFADCLISTKIDAGSHTILIATAMSITVNDGEPLLAFNRALHSLSALG
jgi:flavin reductase